MPTSSWYPQGIVYSGKTTIERPISFREILPPPALSPYVQCFWQMEWALAEPLSSQVVPTGCVNLVFECGSPQLVRSKIVGTRRVTYHRILDGKAALVGVRFTPGGFHPFFGRGVAELTDTVIPIPVHFGPAGESLEADIFATSDFVIREASMREFLLKRMPSKVPEELRWIAQVVEAISGDESILGTGGLLERFPLSESKLQRTFKTWVGISPKRFIRTKRFQSALARLQTGEKICWSTLALDLGYYDQAHFIHDFRSITGSLPSELS